MSQLYLLALFANSLLVKDMMVKLFEIDNERDLRTVADTYAMCQQLHECLPVILEGTKVFDKKDVEDPVDVALAYREKMVRLFFCHKVDKCAADLRAHDLIG
ncbi:hypothetical protein Tco_1482818 [Tanacetum coccineum]